MPDAILKAELWEVFGSRTEYLRAPLSEVFEQRCRIVAKHNVEAKQNAELESQMDEQRRQAGRY